MLLGRQGYIDAYGGLNDTNSESNMCEVRHTTHSHVGLKQYPFVTQCNKFCMPPSFPPVSPRKLIYRINKHRKKNLGTGKTKIVQTVPSTSATFHC